MSHRRSAAVVTGAVLAAFALAGAAQAQRGGRPQVTLYELPNFQGASITLTDSTPDLGKWRFNDRAQSARFEGRWRACEHDDFRGRCQEISGPVPDLTTYGLFGQISSLEPAGGFGGDRGNGYGGRPPFPPPGRGPDRDARGFEGAHTVFFPRPTVDGLDLAAGERGADVYCRRQGLGGAVWFNSSERARQAIGPEGQLVGRSPVIRDLLCRRD